MDELTRIQRAVYSNTAQDNDLILFFMLGWAQHNKAFAKHFAQAYDAYADSIYV